MTRHRITHVARGAIRAAALAATALAAGCVKSPPPMSYPLPPISGPQPIDGRYDGLMQLIRGDVINCGNSNEFHLKVANQSFSYELSQPQAPWKPVIVFTATIGPDGAFNATSGTGYMRGTLTNGHMQGRISGDICGFDFNADRTGNW